MYPTSRTPTLSSHIPEFVISSLKCEFTFVLENVELITSQKLGRIQLGELFKVRDYISSSLLLTLALKIIGSEALAQMVGEIKY